MTGRKNSEYATGETAAFKLLEGGDGGRPCDAEAPHQRRCARKTRIADILAVDDVGLQDVEYLPELVFGHVAPFTEIIPLYSFDARR